MRNSSGKKAALHSLGCKVNAYETEAMQQMLADAGYEIVPFSEPADLYVINTCTVTNIADKKSRQMIHRARKQNPNAVIAAAGCYAQMAPDVLEADEAVDLVIGNNQKKDLIAILEAYEADRKMPDLYDVSDPDQPYEELSVARMAEHTRAFIKVQDGCDQFCSYCIIPYARGRVKSRAKEEVIREAAALAQNGYQEIVLTGIHLSSYGSGTKDSLLDLIRCVHAVDGIKRIRLSSLEPGIITREFAQNLAELPKVCPHFHLSLQSGSDTVLKRMNRKYTTREYLEKCEILRSCFKHPALTTDVIVGFPGESEAEFDETCDFVKKAAFNGIHVFKYSKREGTAAARMDGQVPERVKALRSARLLEISAGLKRDFENWYEGRQVEVLFEEPRLVGEEQCYAGYTREYVKVCFRSDEPLENRIMTVEFSDRLV